MSLFQGFVPTAGNTDNLLSYKSNTNGLVLSRDQYHGVIYNLMTTFDPLLQLIPSVQVQDHTFVVRYREKGFLGEPLVINNKFDAGDRQPSYGQQSYTIAQSHVSIQQDRFAAAAANNLTGNISPWDIMLYELAQSMGRTSALDLYNGPGHASNTEVQGLINLAQGRKGTTVDDDDDVDTKFYMRSHGFGFGDAVPTTDDIGDDTRTVQLQYAGGTTDVTDATRKTALLTLSENINRVINHGIRHGVEYDFIVTDLNTVTFIRHLLGTYSNGTQEYISIFGQQVANGIGASGVSPIPIIASSYYPENGFVFNGEGPGTKDAFTATTGTYAGTWADTVKVENPRTKSLLFVKTDGPAQTNFSNQGGIFRAYVDTQPLNYPGLPDNEFINNGLGVGIASPSQDGNYKRLVGIWNEQIALGNKNAVAILGGFTLNRELVKATVRSTTTTDDAGTDELLGQYYTTDAGALRNPATVTEQS